MPRRRSALVDRLVVGQPGAIAVDQSDAVVLGCAGMADMCGDISGELDEHLR